MLTKCIICGAEIPASIRHRIQLRLAVEHPIRQETAGRTVEAHMCYDCARILGLALGALDGGMHERHDREVEVVGETLRFLRRRAIEEALAQDRPRCTCYADIGARYPGREHAEWCAVARWETLREMQRRGEIDV